jgi:competence protein ComEA
LTLFDRAAVAGLVVAFGLAGIAAWTALVPAGIAGDPGPEDPYASSGAPPASPTSLIVDVEGAVAFPGLHQLGGGARVADAITAAGGYSEAADLVEAARILNLAAPVLDGQQIVVPAVGDGATGGDGEPGLVNLNTADAAALDALPGIGPVTVQKILDARSGQPFAALDDLVERKVLTSSQLDKIRDLVTVP